ncbi:hypothetical protein IIK97_004088 [Salmonella enterica subsp. enterica serovar Nigeria]|nr:hypothetical protein [Salmonella enterica subsp. enterica serovar Nigeria]
MKPMPFKSDVTPETVRDLATLSDATLNSFINSFTADANAAFAEHLRLWSVVRRLIERDIVNGAPACEIAKAVALLQEGEGKCYDLYQPRQSALSRLDDEYM